MPLQTLLDMTAFSNPLLRTLIPTILLAYTLQLLFVIPSVILQTTRFQTLSETLTYIACILTSLSLPYLRVQERFRERARQMDTGRRGSVEYLSAPVPGQEFWAWRQLGGSAVVGVWAVCGEFSSMCLLLDMNCIYALWKCQLCGNAGVRCEELSYIVIYISREARVAINHRTYIAAFTHLTPPFSSS